MGLCEKCINHIAIVQSEIHVTDYSDLIKPCLYKIFAIELSLKEINYAVAHFDLQSIL